MSFPRYPTYKDSGHDWLGFVPGHWSVAKFRHSFFESPEKIEGEVVGPMLSVSGYRGVEIKEYDDENRKRTDEELVGYRIVRPGQLVVNTMWLNYAGLGVSEHEGHVSPAYRSYWITEELDRRYAHHLMRSSVYVGGYTKFITGIRPNSLQMGREDLMVFPVIQPPKAEQVQIADFLDAETAKIDALVAEQEQLITLLKEKRQTVISHAVTKGLDPSVPMKDSGVEWLGEVPAHWDVIPLKHLVVESAAGPYGASLTKDMYSSEGYRVYGQQQVIADDFSIGDYFISEEKYEEMRRYTVYADDVLVSVMGTIGKVAVVTSDAEPGIINPRLVRYRCGDQVQPRFLQRVLMSQKHQEHLLFEAKGTTMDGLNMQTLGRVPVPTPPLIEQAEILNFVVRKIGELDPLLAEAEAAVSLLQERRSALISAAVTGQIDVRQIKQ